MLWCERIHRTFDFAAAAMGIILLAPIFLLTSIAIKLDSDGPIFVREPMFGHDNQRIQLFKFRLVSTHGAGNVVHAQRELVKLCLRPVLRNSRSSSMCCEANCT